jgi:competence ComEA-like helix-hairpin-helix protein
MPAVTPEERAAIIWVTMAAFIGIVANYWAKAHSYPAGVAYINEDICRVNINTARLDELVAVKGIGEKLAQRIIEYRLENGGFDRLQDLLEVKGMTPYRFNKIKEMLFAG